VSVPVAALLVAVTLVGLPFTIVALFAWGLTIYLAKIVVAIFVGRTLLSSTERKDNRALVLLAGLLLIIVVVNLPAIGGIVSLLLTLVGMGLIVQKLLEYLSQRERQAAN
jgi:hypothetical protein